MEFDSLVRNPRLILAEDFIAPDESEVTDMDLESLRLPELVRIHNKTPEAMLRIWMIDLAMRLVLVWVCEA